MLFFAIIFTGGVCEAQNRKIDSLKIAARINTGDSSQVKSLSKAGQASLNYNADTALYYIRKADALAKKINWKKGMAISAHDVGWCYYFVGKFDSALAWYNRSVIICKELAMSKDEVNSRQGKKSAAVTYGAIGDLYASQSDYPNAIKNFLTALKYAEEIDSKEQIAKQTMNIGNIYTAQGNYPKALDFLTRSLQLREETGNKRGIAVNLEGIAGTYYEMNDYENSLIYQFRALDLHAGSGDQRRMGVCFINIANNYIELKNYKKALEYSLKAFEIFREMDDKISYSESLVNLGNVYKHLGKYKEAESYLTKALVIADSLEIQESSASIHLMLSELYKNTGDAPKVFEHYKAYVQVKDSIYSEENKKAQMEAEVNFEFEKKEGDLKAEQEKKTAVFETESKQQKQLIGISVIAFAILLLLSLLLLRSYGQKQRANKILASQKIELQKIAGEKDSLLKEIHHRVKNNLQVISGLLSLQNTEHQSDELKAILKEGQNRVKSMALIHQMLYQNQNLSTIPFQDYLEELSKLIEKSFGAASKKIEVSVNAQNITFDVDTAIPLGLIINELLSNSIKYAFENDDRGGQIDISLNRLENDHYNLTIKDNGKGMSDSFNFETAKSLGLRLVKMLCTQIRAELKIESINGTQIEIKFKDTWKG